MADFIGLYRGRTVSDAELIALCADKRIVEKFFEELLGEEHDETRDAETALEVVRDSDDE